MVNQECHPSSADIIGHIQCINNSSQIYIIILHMHTECRRQNVLHQSKWIIEVMNDEVEPKK